MVQRANKDAGTATSATLAFSSNNTAGNWIGVCIRAGHSGQVFTVTDSRGNTYRRAAQYDVTVDTPNGHTLGIFYAENIAGGVNTITVSDTISGTMRIAIVEYSGVAATNSADNRTFRSTDDCYLSQRPLPQVPGDASRVGVNQNLSSIEPIAGRHLLRTVHSKRVAHTGTASADKYVPEMKGLVGGRVQVDCLNGKGSIGPIE